MCNTQFWTSPAFGTPHDLFAKKYKAPFVINFQNPKAFPTSNNVHDLKLRVWITEFTKNRLHYFPLSSLKTYKENLKFKDSISGNMSSRKKKQNITSVNFYVAALATWLSWNSKLRPPQGLATACYKEKDNMNHNRREQKNSKKKPI